MAKEFKDFDKRYEAVWGSAVAWVQRNRIGMDANDVVLKCSQIAQISSWHSLVAPNSVKPSSTSAEAIRKAVYECDTAEKWQVFRVRMKGCTTAEKLFCLACWFYEFVVYNQEDVDNTHIRVHNYLGALVRGGQLDSELNIVR